MINLLPPDTRANYMYARRNTRLLRWITGLSLGIAGMAVVTGLGMLYINQSINSYQAQIAAGEERLRVHKLQDSQKQVEEITNNLKLVIQVLSKEVMFSKMLQQIGAAMPQGAILTDLSIDKTQGGIDLGARATNYQAATQIQVNLADPKNKVFEKADINQIKCNPPAASTGPNATTLTTKYPCEITIRALFGSNNPYLFINNEPTARGASR